MNNKTVIGIIAGVILLGAVAYSAKPGLFNGGSCSVSKEKTECQSCCSTKETKQAKSKKDDCCSTQK